MKITLLSSCGLAIEQDGAVLLIDALNKQFRCFSGLAPQTFAQMLSGRAPFDAICGILYTHTHPDHYHAARTKQLHESSGAPVFVPQADTPLCLHMRFAPFAVEFHRFAHIPVEGWPAVEHGVYVISAAGKSVYVTADAQIDAVRHREILHGRRVSVAFWNGQSLSYPQMRTLQREAAEQTCIYHIPVDAADASGIRRKCEKNFERFGAELPGLKLLETYPLELTL